MKAIKTVYLGPTNTRGSRIKASDTDGNQITIGYPHEQNQGADAHAQAALALCKKMGWGGRLIAGALSDCYVFTFAGSDEYVIELTDADIARAHARREAILAR